MNAKIILADFESQAGASTAGMRADVIGSTVLVNHIPSRDLADQMNSYLSRRLGLITQIVDPIDRVTGPWAVVGIQP